MAEAGTQRSGDTTLRLSRTFAASRERVFRAFTDPEELKHWFGPSDEYEVPVAEVDLRVGGRYRLDLRTPSGNLYRVAGVYREIRSPERLVYTWRWEVGDDVGETLVTLEFRSLGGSTEVSLTHERFPTPAARDLHRGGWGGSLDRLSRRVG